MTQITLYGAPYSVYVRIARLVLHEIGVNYDLVPIDIFTPDSLPADYASRRPFAKIPAFEHDGFRLFETDAIARYAVAAFGGDSLIPRAARAQARMTQIMRIMDHYAYPVLVWGGSLLPICSVAIGYSVRKRPNSLTYRSTVISVLARLIFRPKRKRSSN